MTESVPMSALCAAVLSLAGIITILVRQKKTNGNGTACMEHLALAQRATRNSEDIQDEKRAREQTERIMFEKLEKIGKDTTDTKLTVAALSANVSALSTHVSALTRSIEQRREAGGASG